MKRIVLISAVLLGIAAAILPFLPLDFLKPGIERVLARGLGRRVEIGTVYLTLFAGPGFSMEGVTVHEDARAGIEPFVYAGTVEARVDFPGLLQGRRGFSNLRFTDATINLVKPERGPWNVQMLMESGADAAEMPSIQVRAGRVNLKFGQTKSVFYFEDADVDVQSPNAAKAVDVRLSAIPLRTDRPVQEFGHFFIRGTTSPSTAGRTVNLSLDLEPSSFEALARLADADYYSLQGGLSAQARLSGPLSALLVEGVVLVDDSRRTRNLDVPFRGTLDLTSQRMELVTTAKQPWSVKWTGEELVTASRWEASLDLQAAPLGPLVAGLRRFHVPIPEAIVAEGTVQGTVAYRTGDGFRGETEVREASFAVPGVDEIRAAAIGLRFNGPSVQLRPVTLVSKETGQPTQVDGAYAMSGDAQGLALKITTKGLPLADSALLGYAGAPFLDRTSHGTLQGTLQYRDRRWSGEYEVRDAETAIEGLAEPLRVRFASVSANRERAAISRMQAEVGGAAMTGEYRWDVDSPGSQTFRLHVQRVDLSAMERLFSPVLSREGGFFARTLRLGAQTAPDWFTRRKVEGVISVGTLEAWNSTWRVDTARVQWNGAAVELSGIDAKITGGGVLIGTLSMDLTGRAPKYRFEGKLNGLPYKGGDLSFQGTLEGSGNGAALVSSLRAEGTLRGNAIGFSPSAVFRTVTGQFSVAAGNGLPQWKLSELKISQGGDLYLGEGATQSDGKLTLDLKSHGKQVRYTDSAAP